MPHYYFELQNDLEEKSTPDTKGLELPTDEAAWCWANEFLAYIQRVDPFRPRRSWRVIVRGETGAVLQPPPTPKPIE
jgi:hypothetical protein